MYNYICNVIFCLKNIYVELVELVSVSLSWRAMVYVYYGWFLYTKISRVNCLKIKWCYYTWKISSDKSIVLLFLEITKFWFYSLGFFLWQNSAMWDFFTWFLCTLISPSVLLGTGEIIMLHPGRDKLQKEEESLRKVSPVYYLMHIDFSFLSLLFLRKFLQKNIRDWWKYLYAQYMHVWI